MNYPQTCRGCGSSIDEEDGGCVLCANMPLDISDDEDAIPREILDQAMQMPLGDYQDHYDGVSKLGEPPNYRPPKKH